MTAAFEGRLTGTHHIRLPVSDVQTAREFWEGVLGYEWEFDFPGDSGPVASAFRHLSGGPNVVLWLDPERAREFAGFVMCGIGVEDASAIDRLKAALDARGIPHGGVQGAFVEVKLPFVRTPGGPMVSFYVKPDPDVQVVRPTIA
ncbi:VOC family protein [Galbitalea soli]|uniref:VOC family protein n=1 Tax=Galbitalea soli TaxID=1268042 RepID=A0A7C9PMN0_9MICO|nr:VOC family protein [Galbitalea soli]NYJ29782.1 catechol 2,3-dioxygenase-like lactoylglutathione lyase family enzyme [Galbitalea soli]